MGDSVRISIGEVPELKSSATTGNPLLAVFPVLDIALIFKLVISALAILMAYDTISGEKEGGTLKLMLSNSVPRHQVLFGKFMGGMITLAIPIAVGFLMISLILELSPAVELTSGDWIRVAMMFALSLIMVSVLLNLGLLLSSVTKRASDTLMLLLFFWILFLLVIPNGGAYLSARLRPVESRKKLDSQVQEIWGRYWEEVRDFSDKNPGTGGSDIQSDATEPWGWYHKFATKSLIRRKQKFNAFGEPLKIEYADKAWQANKGYLDSLKRQKELITLISRASPISLYETLITSLSRTDVSGAEMFAVQSGEYRQQIIEYLYGKKAFSSIGYFATVKEEHLFDVDSTDPNYIENYTKLRERYETKDPPPLDVSGVPHFQYYPEGATAALERILPDIVILCFMSIFLFMCAFAAFLRCDVR